MKHALRLALMAFIGATAVAAPVFAADPSEYCGWYARTAIHQAEVARGVGSCRYLIWENPARWQINYGEHFRWCLSAFGSGGNAREHDARDAALRACGAL